MPIVVDAVKMLIFGAAMPYDRLKKSTNSWGKAPVYRLKNLRFTVHSEGVVITGSLPKYLRGENATPSTRSEIAEALFKLETNSGISLRNGRVWNLEVGTTLSMRFPPIDYLSAWSMMMGQVKKRMDGNGNTVYFDNKTWHFKGYDKGLEMNPTPLPSYFRSNYGLRIELGLRKSLSRIVKTNLEPWELVDPETDSILRGLWEKRFRRIIKSGGFALETTGSCSRELQKNLAALALATKGRDTVEGMISAALEQGNVSSYNATRMRNMLKDLQAMGNCRHQADLNCELDEAVEAELALSE